MDNYRPSPGAPQNFLSPDLPQRIADYGRDLRSRFEQFIADLDALAALEGEISEDDVPGLFADFTALATMGVKFDPRFSATIQRLHRSVIVAGVEDDTDGDQDASDENLIDDGSVNRLGHPATVTRPPGRMVRTMKIPGDQPPVGKPEHGVNYFLSLSPKDAKKAVKRLDDAANSHVQSGDAIYPDDPRFPGGLL